MSYQPMQGGQLPPDPNAPPPNPFQQDYVKPQQQQQQPYGNQMQQPPSQSIQQPFNEMDHQPPPVPSHLQPAPDLDMSSDYWSKWQQTQKLSLNQNYRLFRVPKLREDIADSTIIGVIDQSGSMNDCFHWLAREWNEQIYKVYPKTKCCIFHNFAMEQECLDENPEMGTTDVEGGFQLLNQVVNKQETLNYVTIIFVSDGMDNNPETIYQRLDNLVAQIPKWKKINFLTIGVGDGFPTYMAMQLRQMYHNGENNIPPVFLVYNQHLHENWKVTFNVVNKYLEHNDPVQINSICQQFPWTPPTSTVYENSWVFTTNMDVTSLNFNGATEIQHIEQLLPQEVLDIGSVLLSNAQLSNLKFQNEDSTRASVEVSNKIVDDLKKKFWGRRNKKKEEKEQLVAVQSEMKELQKDPNLKKNKESQGGDSNLALKLAVGAVGAGVGLYWMANNYGEFAQLIGGMDFQGVPECGCCGELCEPVCNTLGEQCECCGDIADQVMGALNCDSCGCLGDVLSAGEGCISTIFNGFMDIIGYICSFICSLLAG